MAPTSHYLHQNHHQKRRLGNRYIYSSIPFLSLLWYMTYHSLHPPRLSKKQSSFPSSAMNLPQNTTDRAFQTSEGDSFKWDPIAIRDRLIALKSDQLPHSPRAASQDVCLVIGRDPGSSVLWTQNSRSICMTSPVCIPTNSSMPVQHTSSFANTSCRVVTPAFDALPSPLDEPRKHEPNFWPCPEMQHRLQLCPWPNVSNTLPKPCIPYDPTSPSIFIQTFENAVLSNTVFDGITIVVPRYPFAANIFHFAATMATVAHAARNIRTIVRHYGVRKLNPTNSLDKLPLNILFLTQRRLNLPWQSSLQEILENSRMLRALPNGLRVSYITEQVSAHACVRNPIMLGQRGHVNIWPFPNSTAVPIDGSVVPQDAVEFRDDVYTALNVSSMLISKDADGGLRIAPPPLVVGYSRRAGRSSVLGKGVHAAGTVRRFSDEDETWFSNMLAEETKKQGVELRIFTISAKEKFVQQVNHIQKIGFLVGIHGANLANCIFMRPFGAILEIFPANMVSNCYMAGANSGLAYFNHTARVEASPEESGCTRDEERCWVLTRQRMVKISTKEDRDKIQSYMQKGVARLIDLNKRFGQSGIPVEFDRVSSTYSIIGV